MSTGEIAEIFEQLRYIRDKVTRAATNIDHVKEARGDHERRIRALEQWQWKSIGIATAAATVGSLLLTILLNR